jgi:hypothetical protein
MREPVFRGTGSTDLFIAGQLQTADSKNPPFICATDAGVPGLPGVSDLALQSENFDGKTDIRLTLSEILLMKEARLCFIRNIGQQVWPCPL